MFDLVMTLEGLEAREHVGALDLYEALVLKRFRGPDKNKPVRDIQTRADFDAEEAKKRLDREAVAKRAQERAQQDREARKREVFEEIRRRYGPQAVQAVMMELQKRAMLARMQQQMAGNNFVFPGSFGANTTSGWRPGSWTAP